MKTISLILTVHNKEVLLERVCRGLLENASTAVVEWIVVLDGCTDQSEAILDRELLKRGSSQLRVRKITTQNIWEVRANNVGLKQASGDYCLLVQDDMVVTEKNFDLRLLKPFSAFEDCFAVTARTAHNNLVKRRGLFKKVLEFTNKIGRENPLGRDIFGVRDVVNRGPLLLDHTKLAALNYLDEDFAPLDLDDHDLCLRAYRHHGWVCGSYITAYDSDPDWGTTRASSQSRKILSEAHKKNEQLLIQRHESHLRQTKHDENRSLPETPNSPDPAAGISSGTNKG